jgi:uncharacterized LabA/DUF88 family protein
LGKAVVLIDGGYLAKVLEKIFHRPQFGYEEFSDLLCTRANCERVRTYSYHCRPYQSNPPKPSEKQRYADWLKFEEYLRKIPRLDFRPGRLQRIGSTFKQKGVDVGLSVDLVKLACKGIIDKAILITGDSDFVSAVDVAKEEGIVTILYYSKAPPLYVHKELLDSCDETYEITQEIIDGSKPKHRTP